MKKSDYKKMDTRSHFSDFWHRAKSWRTNKKICARNERRKLNRETKEQRNKDKDSKTYDASNQEVIKDEQND